MNNKIIYAAVGGVIAVGAAVAAVIFYKKHHAKKAELETEAKEIIEAGEEQLEENADILDPERKSRAVRKAQEKVTELYERKYELSKQLDELIDKQGDLSCDIFDHVRYDEETVASIMDKVRILDGLSVLHIKNSTELCGLNKKLPSLWDSRVKAWNAWKEQANDPANRMQKAIRQHWNQAIIYSDAINEVIDYGEWTYNGFGPDGIVVGMNSGSETVHLNKIREAIDKWFETRKIAEGLEKAYTRANEDFASAYKSKITIYMAKIPRKGKAVGAFQDIETLRRDGDIMDDEWMELARENVETMEKLRDVFTKYEKVIREFNDACSDLIKKEQ